MTMQTVPISDSSNAETGFRMATLVAADGDNWLLDDTGFRVSATLAFSCLVTPQVHDRVLYVCSADGDNIIVSIVSRPQEQTMDIEFPQGVNMRAPSGSISIAASKLNMLSGEHVQKSTRMHLDVDELNANGIKLNASFDNIVLLAKTLSSMARQVVSKCMSYMRHSENLDQVRAASMTRSASGLYSQYAEHSVMQSRKDTKIDGERIHIG
jgi:hypothetical protein